MERYSKAFQMQELIAACTYICQYTPDPHAKRVIRYMRPSDYAVWAGATATFPALLYGYGKQRSDMRSSTRVVNRLLIRQAVRYYPPEMADPTKLSKKGITPALRFCTFLGFCGGFLLAYQRSTCQYLREGCQQCSGPAILTLTVSALLLVQSASGDGKRM